MMRVLVVEDNALLRHHLKVQLGIQVTRSMQQKMPGKLITTLMSTCRISLLSI